MEQGDGHYVQQVDNISCMLHIYLVSLHVLTLQQLPHLLHALSVHVFKSPLQSSLVLLHPTRVERQQAGANVTKSSALRTSVSSTGTRSVRLVLVSAM